MNIGCVAEVVDNEEQNDRTLSILEVEHSPSIIIKNVLTELIGLYIVLPEIGNISISTTTEKCNFRCISNSSDLYNVICCFALYPIKCCILFYLCTAKCWISSIVGQ